MAISLRCPKCDKRLKLATPPSAGEEIECPSCGRSFEPDIEEAESEPRSRNSKSNREDEDDESPSSRKSSVKRRRDDDEDDRPRRSRTKQKEKTGKGLVIGLVAGGGVLLLAIVGVVWAMSGKKPEKDAAANPNPNPIVAPVPGGNPNPANPNPPNPNTIPSKELLEKTKRATALIRVDVGTKSASGSGFLIRSNPDAAYIVTNFHVVSVHEDEPPPQANPGPQFGPGRPPGFPGRPPSIRPPGFGPPGFGPRQAAPKPKVKAKVYVVLNSGTPEEQTHPAEVVAIDPEADLATLRITGARNLPEPLDVTQDATVNETMPVFIFGFPGGDKTITIGEGKISQLRRDDNNVLNDVQINGQINPGNSGGPVVDAQGRLIGIAVATVRGKNIGFAIPAAQLNHMLKGSVLGGLVFQVKQRGTRIDATGEMWFLDRKSKVLLRDTIQGQVGESTTPLKIDPNEFLVSASLNDPMHKINVVNLHYAMAANVLIKPDAMGWTPIANAQKVTLQLRDDEAIGTFKLTAGSVADETYAFQFSYVNADGQTIFTQPHSLRLTFPKNPKSVTLKITTPLDEPSRRYLDDTVLKTFAGMNVRASRTAKGVNVEIEPVDDPKTIIDKIAFGEVVSVEGRTITVAVKKVELPAPTEQELKLALDDLKSSDHNRHKAGAERLSKVYVIVPDRRVEIAKALEGAALDKDIFLRLPALRALNLWSGPENVAGLVRGLEIEEGQTRVAICTIIAKYKDPVAAPALAKLLPAQFERGAASAALKAIGPAAEKVVLPFITHKDSWTSMEACNILKEIGTAESIAPLQGVLKGKPDFMVGPAATNALKSIQERKKLAP